MGADAFAKRYFPLIVCALLAAVALFQGRGIAALIQGQLPATVPGPASSGGKHAPASDRMSAQKHANAQPILARNAFDSVTGPLDKVIAPPPPPSAVAPIDEGPAPDEPLCSSGSLVLLEQAADPAWSFVMIKTASGSKLRRVGDDVDGQIVKEIAWNRVVLSGGTGACRLDFNIKHQSADTPPPPPASATAAPSAGPAPKPTGPDPSDVKKVSDNEYIVSASALDKATGIAAELKKGASLVPGKGIRLRRIEPNSLLGMVGVTSGDIVTTINGFDMNDLDKTAEGYSRLKSAKQITLGIERNNAPVTITVRVQ